MDDDEAFVLVASVLLAVAVGLPWYARVFRRTLAPPSATRAPRRIIAAVPITLLGVFVVVLTAGAAREVREQSDYVVLFAALGAVWLIGVARATAWLGIHLRDDAVERNNLAAAIGASGALAGGMAVYAFANLGEGDTIWTTIGPAWLATVLVWVLWAAHQTVSGATDAITIDRDVASGIRFAGMTLGTGLVLGRAVAGDYVSARATVRDLFAGGWPALPLAGLSAVIQVRLRPTKVRLRPNPLAWGLGPALAYLALATAVLVYLGSWRSAVGK